MEEANKKKQEKSTQQQEKEKLVCTFYLQIRALAVICKFFGTFPVNSVIQRDGRNIYHKWLCPTHIWDLLNGVVFLSWYTIICKDLENNIRHGPDEKSLRIWLMLTFFFVVARGIIQFILVQLYAPRLPQLLKTFEEYWQGIGQDLLTCKKHSKRDACYSMVGTIIIFNLLLIVSYFFFRQFNVELGIANIIPMALSYTFANIWNAMPMNMFTKICKQLTYRFSEVRDGVRQLRENNKDVAVKLEKLRLQHAALVKIVGLLQRCYGMQLAANFLFMLIDTILQLFVFFALTYSDNLLLLLLALFYIIMCIIILVIVEKLQRSDDGILEEIAQFEVNSASREQQIQIQLFTAQLTAKPVRLSASGFFDVNNAMLCTILGAVASYLVMMVQFAPYIEHNLLNRSYLFLPSTYNERF